MKAGAWASIALLCVSAAVGADVTDTEEMTFNIDADGRISLENINGDIYITGGTGSQVHMVAKKKAGSQEYLEELKVVVDADNDYIRIETRHPKTEGRWFPTTS